VENKGKLILTEIFPSVQKHDIFLVFFLLVRKIQEEYIINNLSFAKVSILGKRLFILYVILKHYAALLTNY
jgi:hypothetical protein